MSKKFRLQGMWWEGLDVRARSGPGSSISDILEAARRVGGQVRCGFFGILDGSGAFFREKADRAYCHFSLRGKHCSPYLQDHGPWAGDLRCVELSFFDFVRQLDPAQRYFRIPERLEPQ